MKTSNTSIFAAVIVLAAFALQAQPAAIAVDAKCIYWLNAGVAANENVDGSVMMMAK